MKERNEFMNKKRIIISSVCIFLLCCLTHFLYDWMPNFVFSILFPVNESTWEHMKMIYTTILLFETGRTIYFFYKGKQTHLLASWICSLISIPIFLILYLPIYYAIGYHMIISLTLLFITIVIEQTILEKIKEKEDKYAFFFAITGIILSYLAFGYLTYHPIHMDLFYDHQAKTYGIK